MTKVVNIIGFIKNDVNKEESMILSIFEKILQINSMESRNRFERLLESGDPDCFSFFILLYYK